MISHLATIALRVMNRYKLISFINIFGLSIGLMAFFLIVIFANNELSFDHFHSKKDNIFMVYKERITPNGVQPTYDTWVPLMDQMKKDFPEVIDGTRYFATNTTLVVENVQYNEPISYIDRGFFELFDFKILEGNPANPIPNENSVLITESVAKKFFGNLSPIDKEIEVEFQKSYVVSGVLEDTPGNSSIDLNIMMLFSSHPHYSEVAENWDGSFLNTYILTNPQSDITALEAKFPQYIESIWDADVAQRTNFRLLPLVDNYQTFVGDPKDSYILLTIAFGILLIASINFVNLSTAQSSDRSKEIGVRKVLGGKKDQLFGQFMVESMITSLIATVIAVLLTILVNPVTNSLLGIETLFVDLINIYVILILISFSLVLGAISGIFPALQLSGFGVIPALKGNIKNKGRFRNVLVVTQFALSILLISGTLIVLSQINHMKSYEMGFNKSNLMVVPISAEDFEDQDEADARLETFKNELFQFHAIESISTSTHIPTRWSGGYTFVRPEGWDGDPLRMRYTYHDAKFFETYGIEMLHGSGFLPDSAGNQRDKVVLNQAATRAFGFDESSETNTIMIGDNRIQVAGTIRDFNFESLREEIGPILHFHRIPANRVHNYITIRYSESNRSEVINYVQSKWGNLTDILPYQYFFVEDEIAGMYESETRMFNVVSVFTGISLIVACLGLFGLTSFMIEKRKKEIGIRKVLGANPVQIVNLLSTRFMQLVLISFLVSVPVSLYVMTGWLNDFANAITMKPWMFISALLISGGIGFFTLCLQTFNAAYANPVKSIRTE